MLWYVSGRGSSNTPTCTTTSTTTTTTWSTIWTGGTRACPWSGRAPRPGASACCAPTCPRQATPPPSLPKTPLSSDIFRRAPGSTATIASPSSRGSIPDSDLTPSPSSFALTPSLDLAWRTPFRSAGVTFVSMLQDFVGVMQQTAVTAWTVQYRVRKPSAFLF